MKIIINYFCTIIVFIILLTTISCNSTKTNKNNKEIQHKEIEKENEKLEKETLHFQCPLKCEGEKTYFDEDKCPICKMDLKEVVKV